MQLNEFFFYPKTCVLRFKLTEGTIWRHFLTFIPDVCGLTFRDCARFELVSLSCSRSLTHTHTYQLE